MRATTTWWQELQGWKRLQKLQTQDYNIIDDCDEIARNKQQCDGTGSLLVWRISQAWTAERVRKRTRRPTLGWDGPAYFPIVLQNVKFQNVEFQNVELQNVESYKR
jgi:hypothetical protein